jgi:ABC-type glycerol-3-phosphate transport system permease component
MGIISEIGRKDIRVRLLIWCISISLVIGALTMIYPFALMISGSSKSGIDISENNLIPSFLKDDEAMYCKSIEALFNEESELFQSSYDLQNGDFKKLELPRKQDINNLLVDNWNQFIEKRDYKQYYYGLAFVSVKNSKNTSPINLRRLKSMLSKRFDGNLAEMNQAMGLELVSWNVLFVRPAHYLNPRIMPNTDTELYRTYYTFKEKIFNGSQEDLSLINRYFINPEGYFKNIYLRAQYTQRIENYNAKHKTKYNSWDSVKLTRNYPADKKIYTDLQREDWEDFVRTLLNRFWIKVKPAALPFYHIYLQTKYENKIADLNKEYNSKYKSFNEIKLVTQLKQFPFFGACLADWDLFIRGWIDEEGKLYQIALKDLEITGAIYDFRNNLKKEYKTIAAANEIFDNANEDFKDKYDNWNSKIIVNSKALSHYQSFLKARYENKIVDFNKLYGSKYKSFDEIKMVTQSRRFSSFRKRLYDWGRFLVGWIDVNDGKRYQLPIKELQLTATADVKYKTVDDANRAIANAKKEFIKWLDETNVDVEVLPKYHTYLKAKYIDKISKLNKQYNSKYKEFAEIKLVSQLKKLPSYGARLTDWSLFIIGWDDTISDRKKFYQVADKNLKPLKARKEIAYAYNAITDANEELEKTTNKINDINTKFADSNKEFNYDSWSDIRSQQQASHYLWIKKNSAMLKWEFVRRNFISVFSYIALHGYAIWNTIVYCSAAVLCALIVNPLAAYALSRFNPPSTYKILLFLMVTMAFPPMVTQIPVFLLLRELSLLNTYGALILPALANGYSIFLLKGFFDSLPQELYESAQIDGASETRIFLQITMSLSKPILAVIGLQTFQLAYSNFMMALLYCQDEKMWTIMPWLYQLQSNSCSGVIFASLIIAALPTFLVFTFCQNIIMRGIVVPVEK